MRDRTRVQTHLERHRANRIHRPAKGKSPINPPPQQLTQLAPPVRLVPVRHLPTRSLHRAVPHRRRVLLWKGRRAQVRLARHGRSFHGRPRIYHSTNADTDLDGVPAPAWADTFPLASHSPTTHKSRERAAARIRHRLRANLRLRLSFGILPNAHITS